MIAHIYYKNKFVNQDESNFSSFNGVEKIRIRSNNGNTFCVKEVDGNMIIVNE